MTQANLMWSFQIMASGEKASSDRRWKPQSHGLSLVDPFFGTSLTRRSVNTMCLWSLIAKTFSEIWV